jgi:hypothetical protein
VAVPQDFFRTLLVSRAGNRRGEIVWIQSQRKKKVLLVRSEESRKIALARCALIIDARRFVNTTCSGSPKFRIHALDFHKKSFAVYGFSLTSFFT